MNIWGIWDFDRPAWVRGLNGISACRFCRGAGRKQTGKTAGDLPLDKGAFWKWLLGIAAVSSAAVLALFYLIWLL